MVRKAGGLVQIMQNHDDRPALRPIQSREQL